MAKRAGYGLLAVSMVAFFAGAARGFTSVSVAVVLWSFGASSVLLLPAIILGYAVAKAEREDPGPS
jgi:hypothetical protein